jgi:dTDP-4-amino-4,6-dideoxygalactose transaminase
VDARPFWKPIHLQVPFGGCPREELGVTDGLWSTLVTLPCSTSLSNADQSTVIKHVQELLG